MLLRTTVLSSALLVSFVLGFTGCGDDTNGGTGGSTSTGGTTGQDDGTFPSDLSAAGITEFLSSESYKIAPWTGDAAIRATTDSPHTRVRVFYNPTLLDGDAAGDGGLDGEPAFPAGSAAVKELYDATDTLVGRAAMFRTETDQAVDPGWVYYCWGPAGECATGSPDLAESAATADTDDTDCSFCHGNTILTKL